MQIRNPAQVRLLSADFQRRYESNFAWRSVCAQIQALPGLRGFWPMSSFDEGGDAFDISGQGRTLSYNGNPEYNHSNLIHYIDFDGTGDYLGRGDEAGLDIIGTETYVAGTANGLTMGGWFWFDVVAGGEQDVFLKFNIFPDGSYGIFKQNAQEIVRGFVISGGATTYADDGITRPPVVIDTWYFIVLRFDPSTELRLWANSAMSVNTVGIPATIDNSPAPLTIGASGIVADEMTGRASLCFLCAAALGTGTIRSLYQQSRALFGA